MKYWCVNIWPAGRTNLDAHIESLAQEHYDAIILFCYLELGCSLLLKRYPILEIAKKKNIKIYAVVGSDYVDNSLADQIEFVQWPTYFFKETLVRYSDQTKITDLNELEYKYHYVYLNGKSHKHRGLLIDYLSQLDLLKHSAYSWHADNDINSFSYFDGRKKILDSDFSLNNQAQGFIPREYYQSFFQLVPETSVHVKFITEKTILPLLIGKPFLISGATGIHQALRDYGFELYDELFDYSFDTLDDAEARRWAIAQNIKRIVELDWTQCKSYHAQLLPKIYHNRQRAIELAYDKDFVPELVKHVIDLYKQTGEALDERLIRTELQLKKINHWSNL